MTLRANPVLEQAQLPDGRPAEVRVGIAEDPYIDTSEINTVALELRIGGTVAAAVNTILAPEDGKAARKLAADVAARLRSGLLEPTTAALEPLADSAHG